MAMHIHSPATATTCKQQMPRAEKALLALAALQDGEEVSEEPEDSIRAYKDAHSKCHEVTFRPFLSALSGQLAKAASQIPDSYPDIVQAGLEDSLRSTFMRESSINLAGQIDDLYGYSRFIKHSMMFKCLATQVDADILKAWATAQEHLKVRLKFFVSCKVVSRILSKLYPSTGIRPSGHGKAMMIKTPAWLV